MLSLSISPHTSTFRFGIDEAVATTLLSKNKWSVHDAMDAGVNMMQDDARSSTSSSSSFKKMKGLPAREEVAGSTINSGKGGGGGGGGVEQDTCIICFDTSPDGTMTRLSRCGHGCCKGCWTGYLESAIANGADQVVHQVISPPPSLSLSLYLSIVSLSRAFSVCVDQIHVLLLSA
jgi:hypothetical protein